MQKIKKNLSIYRNSKIYSIIGSFLLLFTFSYVSNVKAAGENKVTVEGNYLCTPQTVISDPSIDDIIEKIDADDEKYIEKELGNSTYCPVYCVEKDTFLFPGFVPMVDAGEHFTWTIGQTNQTNILKGLTVQLEGDRTCRSIIDLGKWERDYNDILRQIEEEISTLERSPISISSGSQPCDGVSTGPRWCGWHRIDTTIGYTSGKNGNATTWWDRTDGGERSIKHRFYEVPWGSGWGNHTVSPAGVTAEDFIDPVPPDDANHWRVNSETGRVEWFKVLEEWEYSCPCEEKENKTYRTTEFQTKSATETELTQNSTNGKAVCGEGYPEEIWADEDYRIECTVTETEHQDPITLHLCENPVRGNVYWSTECGEGIIDTGETKDQPQEDLYKMSMTEYKRTCNFSGTSVTPDDFGVCQKVTTRVKTCPDGYHWGGSDSVCYKTDVSKLIDLVNRQQTLLDILRNCSNLNFDYNLDTQMSVEYDEPVYGRNENLIRKEIDSRYEDEYIKKGQLDANGQKVVNFYVCETVKAHRECYNDPQPVTDWWNEQYGKSYIKDLDYELPRSMYQYVLLPEGKSVDRVPDSYASLEFQNYLNIGYSNYPVHFATPAGLYNLDIHFWNVGYRNRLQQSLRVEGNYSEIFGSDGNLLHDCLYDVDTGKPFGDPEYKCEVVNGEYYNGSGYRVNADEFFNDCGQPHDPELYKCQIVNGKYYDNDGWEVSETTYSERCGKGPGGGPSDPNDPGDNPNDPNNPGDNPNGGGPYKCLQVNGVFYDSTGNPTTERSFLKECGPATNQLKCRYVNGIYYGINGQVTGVESFQSECIPTSVIPDPGLGSIRLIYRPISLVDPFPGTDGLGRLPGNNWNDPLYVTKYILTNRNTNDYNIYNRNPMYEITLNPNLIKQIRNYNHGTTYDDWEMDCANGRECKSHFIREDFSAYITGCGTGNWNDCDKQDGYTR